jgi:hypothetical protein
MAGVVVLFLVTEETGLLKGGAMWWGLRRALRHWVWPSRQYICVLGRELAATLRIVLEPMLSESTEVLSPLPSPHPGRNASATAGVQLQAV